MNALQPTKYRAIPSFYMDEVEDVNYDLAIGAYIVALADISA